MRKIGLLAGICGVAAFALATAAGAVTLGGAKGLSEAQPGMVDLVHGCHREVRRDRFGWHFHGRRCHRVNVEREGPRPRCYYIGPLRICD
jgi:hypothetical protein